MPRIKERRKYKLIAFKAYYDEDEDILHKKNNRKDRSE